MKALWFLAILAIAQCAFLVLIAILLVINRSRQALRARARANSSARLAPPLREWLLGAGSVQVVVDALGTLGRDEALAQTVLLATRHVPATQMPEFAEALSRAAWVQRVLRQGTSRRWWKRLAAARMLSIVGGPRDRDQLLAFLDDPHPAVQGVAAAALPRIEDVDAVARVLDGLAARPLAIRIFQFSILRETHALTGPALAERLAAASADAATLEAWIALADAIGTPDLLARVADLAHHPDAGVRVAVARALKKYFHRDVPRVLLSLLIDADWRVRAQAARSLGSVGGAAAIPELRRAMQDPQWWVRFRAGLALAQLGEDGREALRDARAGNDRYTAEMARLVSGLSPGSLVELSEA